jgi:thymidylate synthase
MGDAHIYIDHIDALKTQLKREPKAFPHLEFRREINNIDDFRYDDFIISGYEPHPQIKMKMSV